MPREKPLIDGVELIEFMDRVQDCTLESTLTSCKPPYYSERRKDECSEEQ